MSATKAEFGSGALFKAAGVVYGVMVCSGLVLLANVLVLAAPLLGPLALAGFALTGPSIVAVAISGQVGVSSSRTCSTDRLGAGSGIRVPL